jgi:hypothetical protein
MRDRCRTPHSPEAKRIEHREVRHGATVIDNYAWIFDRKQDDQSEKGEVARGAHRTAHRPCGRLLNAKGAGTGKSCAVATVSDSAAATLHVRASLYDRETTVEFRRRGLPSQGVSGSGQLKTLAMFWAVGKMDGGIIT